VFAPSRHQMRFKRKAYADHKDVDWTTLSPVDIQTLTGNRSVQRWCEDPQFVGWFTEPDIVATELQLGAEDAVRALREVVNADDIGPDGRFSGANYVSAATKLLELAGYTPPAQKIIQFKDAEIDKMSDQELREFVGKNIHLVKK